MHYLEFSFGRRITHPTNWGITALKEYDLTCDCGQVTRIPATDAGHKKTCACGREFEVPSLGELRAAVNECPKPIPEESAPPGEFSTAWIGAAIVIFGPVLATIVRLTIIQAGHFYLEKCVGVVDAAKPLRHCRISHLR